MPSMDTINQLLDKAGFSRALSPSELTTIFERFINYNVSRELQGSFLATEQVRTDKLIDWIKREKPTFTSHTPAMADFASDIYIQPRDIDPKTMVFVGGVYKPCFDGYTPADCNKIIKAYRLPGETNLEAYERIKRAGVANCKKYEVASPEFVRQILDQYNPTQQQVAR